MLQIAVQVQITSSRPIAGLPKADGFNQTVSVD